MADYKIIATDLDGTLLDSDQKVSIENKHAISELTAKGVYVVPSTGRALYEMPAEVRDDPNIRYIIHTDGAAIYDKVTGKNITISMSRAESDKMLDIIAEYETSSSVRYGGICYVDSSKHNTDDYTYNRVGPEYIEHLYKYAEPTDNFESFCRGLDCIEMICTFFHSEDDRIECEKRFNAMPEYQTASSVTNSIEIFSGKAGKGSALLTLADMLGVDRAATIAVGDSTNDSDGIRAAGLALAVQNACDELKELADEIICDNDSHVMKYILDKYIK